MIPQQQKQSEWFEQWQIIRDDELFLFEDWISPHTLDTFKGKTVLECGCGSGQHTNFMAQYAKSVVAVDLNTVAIAQQRNAHHDNVRFVEADIATMQLPDTFDIVISIGVVHHTDHPEKTIANMKRHLKPGGIMIVWVYSQEGNLPVRLLIEPARKLFLSRLSRKSLLAISSLATALMYLPIYTVYLLPLKFLPYYDYFENFRRLSFQRNVGNLFDKLNAPQTDFISKKRAEAFVADMVEPHVSAYKGVSWRVSGRAKESHAP